MNNTTAANWTIAFRKPRANRFQRVTNWSGSWDQARDLAQAYGELYPELEIWYVPTAEAEALSVTIADKGNILAATGRRVKVVDTATISDEDLAKLFPAKKLGDMTPAERDAAVKNATQRFQTELEANAPAIAAILEDKTGNQYAADAYLANQSGDQAAALEAVRNAWRIEPGQADRWRKLLRTYRGLPAVPSGTPLDDQGDVNFEEVGREAFRTGEMAAPALNAQVMAAVGDNQVGDPETMRIMQAFTRGYDAEREEQAAQVALAEAPAAPGPRYVAVPTGMDLGFVAMVKDTRRDQTVPGSSVTNMEAAVQHATRLNSIPRFFAGRELDTNMWCVKDGSADGPRCSPRFYGPTAQADAEAKALEMNRAEGLLLPVREIPADEAAHGLTKAEYDAAFDRAIEDGTSVEEAHQANLDEAAHDMPHTGEDGPFYDESDVQAGRPDADELAEALAALDAEGGFNKLSYQEQARFILAHLDGLHIDSRA